MRIVRCPICIRGGGYKVHNGTRDNGSIDVYRCENCGTRFLSINDRNYDYENGFMHAGEEHSSIDIKERLRILEPDDNRRFEMVRDICKDKKVLDFGCGFGGFIKNISQVAESCVGVELGKIERKYLQEAGIECYKTIEECGGQFDVITLFHVFEHLANPREWLDKFSKHLCKGGYLVIEVPNADDVLLSLYESEAFADFTYWSAHLFLYTVKSLSLIIEQSVKYEIADIRQVQRYTLANHLMWLAKGLPGGHNEWDYLDSKELNDAYADKLKSLNKCDTLFFILRKK